jgi:two-component system, NtrC family, sensor kinase
VEAVNSLAGRLIREQELLATNVRSLNQTNRELTETTAELVRAARLASVGTLAAGVAHEIGNPLGALRGYLDVIRNRADDPAQVRELLGEARSEVERIDGIIRHILDFGRPTVRAGELPRVDPLDVTERVMDLMVGREELEEEWVQVEAEAGLPRVRAHTQHWSGSS